MTKKPDPDGRRRFVCSLAGLAACLPAGRIQAQALSLEADYAARLRQGNCLLLIRHALTQPGLGDPPGFQINDCSSQRNLSEEGRAQARRIGAWCCRHGLKPSAVRSSQWCRCLDTAKEAFAEQNVGYAMSVTPWPALNSFFQGQGDRAAQLKEATRAARRLVAARSGQFEVWVTHQVVITGLTGRFNSMGEMLIADADLSLNAAADPPLRVLSQGLTF